MRRRFGHTSFRNSYRPADDAGYAAFYAELGARHPNQPNYPDLGPWWDFDDDDEVRKRLPRLAALYRADG